MPKRLSLRLMLLAWLWLTALAAAASVASEIGPPRRADETAGGQIRIVSTLPSLTEICFALGLGDSLVGVSDYCNYPPEAKKITRIGGVINPNLEQVVALAPDFVLIQATDKNLIAKYDELGLPTLIVKTQTVDDVLGSIAVIGQRTGAGDRAVALVSRMRAELDAMRNASRGAEPVKTLLVIGHEPGRFARSTSPGRGRFTTSCFGSPGGSIACRNRASGIRRSPRRRSFSNRRTSSSYCRPTSGRMKTFRGPSAGSGRSWVTSAP